MATLILPTEEFNLQSTFSGHVGNFGETEYTAPTTSYVTKTYDASALPNRCVILSAILTVRYRAGYSGGSLKINESTDTMQDVSGLLQMDTDGKYQPFFVQYAYKAYGEMGGVGDHRSVCVVTSSEVEIVYEEGEIGGVDEETYREAALSTIRSIRPRAVMIFPSGAQQVIGPEQIIKFTISEGVSRGILLGAVASSVMEMTLANANGEWLPGGAMRGSRTPLGARMRVEIGLKVLDKWLYQPAGIFEITEFYSKSTAPTAHCTGYDAMSNEMEDLFVDRLSYPVALTNLLSSVASQAGLSLNGALAANALVMIPNRPDWGDGCTLRKALSWICQAGASYGYINREGGITIAPAWRTDKQIHLRPDNYLENNHDDRRIIVNGIKVIPYDKGDAITSYVDISISPNMANSITIEKNPLFVSSQSIAQIMADGIRDAMGGASWRAANFRWRGDPSVYPGYRASVIGRIGDDFETTIMSQSMTWDQGFSMSGRCEIDIGRAFAELGYDETAIGGLPAGTKIRILESDGPAWYTLVDTDYRGYCLLLRDDTKGERQYYSALPSNALNSKYKDSNLDISMTSYYNGLPDETKAFIASVSVPVSSSADASASQDFATRHVFALSAVELGLGGREYEGQSVDYLGTVASDAVYWTREVISGLAQYAYAVDASGQRRNDIMSTARGRRPAFCVYKNTPVTAVEGGFSPYAQT